IDSMELFFNGQTLNKGTDNLFGNQGDGAGNNNNIERVDWIVQAGMTAANPAQSGFPIFERGADDAHDPFCIAAVTALDASGSPSAYGRIVRVATNQYGNMANSNLNWTILRKEEAEPLLYRTTAGVQKRGGVFISMADLGVAANAVIYGYSLFAHDLPPASTTATLLDYENATYFPLNTSSNTTLGGIDLIAIAGLYNITDDVVLPVTLTRWHAEMHNREAVLNWVMQHTGERRFIEIEKSTDNKNWKTISRVPGSHQSFTDANIEKNNYYRLKVVSSSGRFFYSSTKQLSAEPSTFFVSVLSKPKELSITIENAKGKNLTVSVYDSEGRNVVRQAVQLSSNTTRFLLTHALSKGIYLIEIKQGINHVIRRILVP
ncbi:MAG TPA: T9SS type A sorting domain-containing protein, partial [Flavisolibacter sp.]|nr:T9SS type A sorting domain-containing protein [Flavisolibacter sp.]